jgi:hypothetical protein
MSYAQLQYRPHVKPTEQVMTLIANGRCWHFDAWLYPHNNDVLLQVQTRAGGRDVLSQHHYIWDGERLRYTAEIPNGQFSITMQDRAYWSRFDELNRLHWQYIVPMSRRVPDGFRSRSVALHYVRAPSLEPFGDDALNLSQY